MTIRCAAVVLSMLLTACQTVQAPPAAQTPPPLPVRDVLGVHVEARAVDAAGQPALAIITVTTRDITCRNIAETATSESGEFERFVEFGVGPKTPGCVVIEAFAAGSRATMTHNVIYDYASVPDNLAGGELILPRVDLDEATAMAIIERFRTTMHSTDPKLEAELATYAGVPREQLHGRLNDLRRHIRGIQRIEPLGDFRYRLHGAAGRTHELRIIPGALPRIEF